VKRLVSFLERRSDAITAEVTAEYFRMLDQARTALTYDKENIRQTVRALVTVLIAYLQGKPTDGKGLDAMLMALGERRARQGFSLGLVLENFHQLQVCLYRHIRAALRKYPDLRAEMLLEFDLKLCRLLNHLNSGVTEPYLQVQESVIQAQQAFLKHKFSSLFKLVEAISNNLNVREFCEILLEYLCRFYDVRVSAVFLLDEHRRELFLQEATGLSRRFVREQRIPAATGAFQECLDSGRAVAITETPFAADDLAVPIPTPETRPAAPAGKTTGRRPRRNEPPDGKPACYSLYAPMIGRQRTYGVVSIHDLKPRQFSQIEIQQMETLARIVAVAMENARFYDNLIEEKGKMDAIVNSVTDGLILINFHEEILYINEQAARYLRLPAVKLIGAPASLIPERLLANAKEPHVMQAEYLRALMNIVDHPQLEFTLYGGGEVSDIRLTMFPVKDRELRFMGRGLIIEDITREKEINRMKSEFVAIASHTMRTPMTSILGFASLLNERKLPEATQAKYIQNIYRESQRLTGILNDMLDLTNIEAGKISLKLMPLDLAHMLSRLVKDARANSNREIEAVFAPDLPRVFADNEKIRQALQNLLDNAVKYSAGKISVKVAQTDVPAFQKGWDRSSVNLEAPGYFPALVVSIANRGEGIAAEHLDHIFEPFYRLENEQTQQHPGSGLGLTIVRYIVEAHGGKIWAESKSKVGCRFSFLLPLELTRTERDIGRMMS
jgi:signal transduction histidine kinase